MYEHPITTYCIFVTASDSGWNPNTIGAFFPGTTNLQPTYNGSQFLNNITTTLRNINNNQEVGVGDWSVKKSAKFKYMYTQFNWASSTGFNYAAGEEYGATILTIPPFSFTTDLDAITYNGLSGYALPFSYNQTLSYLGTLESIPENTHYIGVSFSTVGTYGTVLRDIKNLYTNENSSTNLIIDDSYNIYVKNRYLNYNTQYALFVDCYSDSTYETLTGSISTYIVAVEPGTQVSGGIITSLGSGEPYSTQNSTNDIISNITDYTPLTSGDFINNIDIAPIYTYSSGDSIATFFVDVLHHISEVFLLDDEVNLHLVLPIFSREINIRSDFWITSDYLPQLAEFINYAWWFVICLSMVYKIDVLVELYNFGDFIKSSYLIYQTRRLL